MFKNLLLNGIIKRTLAILLALCVCVFFFRKSNFRKEKKQRFIKALNYNTNVRIVFRIIRKFIEKFVP